jgi:hypothetical protein
MPIHAPSGVVIKDLPATSRILSAFSAKPLQAALRILNDFGRLPLV